MVVVYDVVDDDDHDSGDGNVDGDDNEV